jgi:hypothetical protein
MAIHDSRLMRRGMVAEGTMAFHFSTPSGFRHEAGHEVGNDDRRPEGPPYPVGAPRSLFTLIPQRA